MNGKRAGWVTKVMEYDVDIKVTKLIRGKGLFEQLAGNTNNSVDDKEKLVLSLQDQEQIVVPTPPTSWLQEMTHFLLTSECPHSLNKEKRRYYIQSIPYLLLYSIAFRKYFHVVLLRCIAVDQDDRVLHEFHEGSAGGHLSLRSTALKIMKGGYYWPSLFKDAHSWVRKCKECAIFAVKEKLAALPLQPIQVEQPFMKWGLDFIGVINPPSCVGCK